VRPPVVAEVTWEGGTRLRARAGSAESAMDWDGKDAASPVQTLAFALLGCMASDVVLILQKGRLPLAGLRARLAAERAETDPRRLVSLALHFEVAGAVPADRVERAIALSRDTYCSVLHSLRPDIALTTTFEVNA
jgi:putative redox protein